MQNVEMRVKGRMDEHWSEWFQDFEILASEENETIMSGEVKDQAALYGLIAKMRDLGLTLISVNFPNQFDRKRHDIVQTQFVTNITIGLLCRLLLFAQ